MSRYFFDFDDAYFAALDEHGVECADHVTASSEALKALCEIAEDHPERYAGRKLRLTVRDSANRKVLTAFLNLSIAWHVEAEHSQAA